MGIIKLLMCMVFELAAIREGMATEHCKVYSLLTPFNGRYCPGDGIVSLHLLPHQCRYTCLQSTTCKAYNYNVTDATCTRFASSCLQAFADTRMEFMLFIEKKADQCYQWVPYSSGDSVDPRMISTDQPIRLICRVQRDGNDLVCYFHTMYNECYASWGTSQFSNTGGYPCQRLRIMDDCTVFWVPYTARDSIHPRAVIAGRMANGDVVYVTQFDSVHHLSGHYVQGGDFATSPYGGSVRTSTTMMMLIVL